MLIDLLEVVSVCNKNSISTMHVIGITGTLGAGK